MNTYYIMYKLQFVINSELMKNDNKLVILILYLEVFFFQTWAFLFWHY
jgi:hypothetical protein